MSTAASGHKTDNHPFSVTDTTHRGLGRLLVLRLGDALKVRLTPIEAHTLALAMFAVRDGRSPEKELFMCPIASDPIFVARVETDGLQVETPAGGYPLGWLDVGALAAALSPAAVPA